MTVIEQLQADVEEHGEVHAIVEEEDKEVEIRQGTATFGEDVLTLDNGQTTKPIATDRIVSWYKPVSFYHE